MSAANSTHVGTLGIACPECLTAIEVPVTAHIKEVADPDGFVLECTPDTADLWAHMWSHTERGRPVTPMTEAEFADALDELDDDHARAVTARIAGKTVTYQVRHVRTAEETP